jgi:pimeloyl-[acyl-carrier protein] methyl ester esterase
MTQGTLVLLPGTDGTGLLFADFVAALGAEIDTVVIDYPRDRSLSHAELQTLVRERLPVGERFVVLGESFSGPIAIALAASPPQNLVGLILCCSFASNPRPELSFLRSLLRLPLPRVPSFVLSPWLLGRFKSDAMHARLDRVLGQVSPAVLRDRLRAALSVDVTDDLRRVQVPMLYLRATQDRLVPASAAKRVAALAQKIRVMDVEAPHLLLQTAPAVAAAHVRAFLLSLRLHDGSSPLA